MKRILLVTTALLGLGLTHSATAQDRAQLIAAAGLPASAAQSMSLTEIAAAKFNRDSATDESQTVSAGTVVMVDPVRHAQLIAAAGLTPDQARHLTLTQLATGKFNAEARQDDVQVQVSTRGPIHALPLQLIAAAGLTPIEARGMSLNDIFVAKINRDSRGDDQQRSF